MAQETPTEPAVGIDLGTTYSVIAYLNPEGNPKTILNEEGDLTTASAVFFDRDGTVVGREALRAGQFETERLAAHAKRDVGEAVFHKKILGEEFPPEVIQALVLKKIKLDAEVRLGGFSKAVITVPAYFNEPRRKATQDAGELAGLQVLDIINEPTAAAIAYGFQSGFLSKEGASSTREVVLIYDLGGGTFDVTLMEIDGKNYNTLATGGDVHLGGIDWDKRIVEHLVEAFKNEHGDDLDEFPEVVENLGFEAAQAKRSLTARSQAKVQITHEGKKTLVVLTRDEFEAMTADLIERTRLTVRRVLKESDTTWDDVTRLLLVGGSTRMPMVQKMLKSESGLELDRSLSPDEAVAHGAAIYAGTLMNQPASDPDRVSVSNVNSHDLGVMGLNKAGDKQRKIMIPRNTQLPATHVSKFSTAQTGQKNISIRVVEGGTDSGEGSSPIGRCLVTDLPKDLPAGTRVEVTFAYKTDGRLIVAGNVPSTGANAEMTIERKIKSKVVQWKDRIEAGILVPDMPSQPAEPAGDHGFVLAEEEGDSQDEAASFVFDDLDEAAKKSKQAKAGLSGFDDFLKGLE